MAVVVLAAPSPVVVQPGDSGPDVVWVQRRLAALRFAAGPVDGRYSRRLEMAVWAFRKANGLPLRGLVDEEVRRALARPRPFRSLVRNGARSRVEIDLGRQLISVWRRDEPVLIAHVSTGAGVRYCHHGRCAVATTPRGDFRAGKRIRGWTSGPLGDMYYPVYFNGGIAIHGSTLVPLRPASHGCVRVPLHLAKDIFRLVRRGDAVYVRGRPLT